MSLLNRIMKVLESKRFVITGKHDCANSSDWTRPASRNRIDHFERYISILKFPRETEQDEQPAKRKKAKLDEEEQEDDKDLKKLLDQILVKLDASKFKRDWIARRVDLIVCPVDQRPFAILGWTGSRQFLRSIKLYSMREFGYKLSSHGLYDSKNVI